MCFQSDSPAVLPFGPSRYSLGHLLRRSSPPKLPSLRSTARGPPFVSSTRPCCPAGPQSIIRIRADRPLLLSSCMSEHLSQPLRHLANNRPAAVANLAWTAHRRGIYGYVAIAPAAADASTASHVSIWSPDDPWLCRPRTHSFSHSGRL